MSKNILTFIICGLLTYVQAQTYNVTVTNEPFVYLENPQPATQEAWDDPDFQVPIGFEFEFFDLTSDQLYSTANSLGGYTSLNQDEDHLYMLIPFYTDLVDRGAQQDSALSPISYKTEGLVGQRVFTLEYKEAGLFDGLEDENSIFLDYISLQVRLHESTGDIEFHIGPNSILEEPEIVFDGYPGPFIGLFANAENILGGSIGEVILLSGDPLNPVVVTDPFSAVTWPIPENTVYRFSRMGTSDGDHLSPLQQPLFSPNPTFGAIHLNGTFANEVIYPITIVDVLGKNIGQWNNESDISASGLASGSYYVIVHTKNKAVTEKLLVLPD